MRQQTLRVAIDWSHDLLEQPDRALFACLSVFVGGAGIEALQRTSGTGLNIQMRVLIGFEPESFRNDPATADAYRHGTELGPDEAVAYALEKTA